MQLAYCRQRIHQVLSWLLEEELEEGIEILSIKFSAANTERDRNMKVNDSVTA